MRWLIYGKVESAAVEALVRHEHQVKTLSEVGLGDDAPMMEILKLADHLQLDVVTADAALPQAVFDQKYWFGRSIVLILAEGAQEQADAIDRLFTRYAHLSPRRLYTVTKGRVKVRQLPARPQSRAGHVAD